MCERIRERGHCKSETKGNEQENIDWNEKVRIIMTKEPDRDLSAFEELKIRRDR